MFERKESEELFAHLKAQGVTVTAEEIDRIKSKIEKLVHYFPKVGILGKTGVGKSSLCNALFGQEIAEVDHIEACTSSPEEYFITLSKESQRGIVIIDTPGIGYREDMQNEALYQDLLPKLDAMLWILKADDRAYSTEQQFYRDVLQPNLHESQPVILVMNQVDKVEPSKEWDLSHNQPGPIQLQNIEKKVSGIRHLFGSSMSKVVYVSAAKNYNLLALVEEIIDRLQAQKIYDTVREVAAETEEPSTILSLAKNQLQTAYEDLLIPLARRYADEVLEMAAEKIKEEIKKKLSSSEKNGKQTK